MSLRSQFRNISSQLLGNRSRYHLAVHLRRGPRMEMFFSRPARAAAAFLAVVVCISSAYSQERRGGGGGGGGGGGETAGASCPQHPGVEAPRNHHTHRSPPLGFCAVS